MFNDATATIRGLLVAGCYDYDVEIHRFAGDVRVIIIGSPSDWHVEDREVFSRLRDSEPRWRRPGERVEYLFMADDALAVA